MTSEETVAGNGEIHKRSAMVLALVPIGSLQVGSDLVACSCERILHVVGSSSIDNNRNRGRPRKRKGAHQQRIPSTVELAQG